MAAFAFELVSPDKQVFSGPAESVLVPGAEGDFLVLAEHAPVMSSIRPGVLDIADPAGKHTRVFVRGGFADVGPLGLIVLAETALPIDDLTGAHLDEEIKTAEQDAADASDDFKRIAQEKVDRLRELKDSMKL
jgi:F-type H+-transporting ATPase subunit epsilon